VTVNFDGGASHDPDIIDHIAKYTFNFGDGGDDVDQTTPTISHSFPNAGLYDVKLVVTDSRGNISDNTAHQLIEVQQPFGVASIVSRKLHGTTPFDIDLPLSGNAGVECRGSASAGNAYQIIYTFNRNIGVAGSATASQAGANATTALGPNANQVTVNLTGVTNAQHLTATLNGVQDTTAAVLNNLGARMDVLVGDVNANRVVSNTDVSSVKGQVAAPVTSSNFRNDVNANGVISNTDVSATKAQVGTTLP
jgi:PKD repeat protein